MNSALVSSNYSVCFGISNRCPLGDEFDMHSSEIRTNESEMPVSDGGVIAKVLANAMGLQ